MKKTVLGKRGATNTKSEEPSTSGETHKKKRKKSSGHKKRGNKPKPKFKKDSRESRHKVKKERNKGAPDSGKPPSGATPLSFGEAMVQGLISPTALNKVRSVGFDVDSVTRLAGQNSPVPGSLAPGNSG